MSKLVKSYSDDLIEVGIDEAGRGPFFGRVYAAVVKWPQNLENDEIKDSKKISSKKRKILKSWIEENVLDFAIGYAEVDEIEKINILQASFLAMHRALDKLEKITPELILVDGNKFKKYNNIDFLCIPKGDDKFLSIAAASILAKEYHDEYILELCHKDPTLDIKYNLVANKGYGTKAHRDGLLKFGMTKYHRKSFIKFL
ncbi:Ribonuclease HII [seawater metagenome]|uniref:Ribonuclease HII n=1 Tax=seawater metagenome TaxID=1561972 RepID=A0A5E8CKN6_9ZZZZ